MTLEDDVEKLDDAMFIIQEVRENQRGQGRIQVSRELAEIRYNLMQIKGNLKERLKQK